MKFKVMINSVEKDLHFSEASFSVQKSVYYIAYLNFD